ncbi:MAG TPA: DUF2505 family protein [Acidimicrobiales bacterium]
MRFDAEQRFDAEVDHLLGLFTDPDFYATLTDLPKISTPELLDHRTAGGRIHISYRQRYTGDLPAAAKSMIDVDKISWIEELSFDLGSRTAETQLKPDHYADRFSCHGRYTFRDLGRGRASRRLDGDLRIRVPLVGGRVESALVSGLKEHADAERELIEERLLAAQAILARVDAKRGKDAKHKNGKAAKGSKAKKATSAKSGKPDKKS